MDIKKHFNGAARVTHIALQVGDVEKSAAFYKGWCGMEEVNRRLNDRSGEKVIWMACPGQEGDFVIVLLSGAHPGQVDTGKERMRHIGLAVESEQAVRNIAVSAKAAGILHWDYQEFPFPVGTLCAVRDPDGHIVEFSFGQPLGRDFKAESQGMQPR